MNKLIDRAKALQEDLVAIRRDIHRHPEIGGKEYRTSKLIIEKLKEFGVENITQLTETSVVALIEGAKDNGKCVAIRADIDALPVEENTGLEYASQNPGYMHACGHDMHTTMLLGAAKILNEMKSNFKGKVKLIFQHSEDTLPGGAKELVEKGVLENPKVDAIVGMHVMPTEDTIGKVYFHKGPVSSAVDLFTFNVTGKGSHGSQPHKSHDPILTACQTVVMLQQIPARYIDPMETVVFPVCMINGGDAVNIIPEKATFSGTARCFKDEVREELKKQIYQVVDGMEKLSGCKIDVDHFEGYPACFNDYDLTDMAYEAVLESLGEDFTGWDDAPMSGSEDFSYFTKLGNIPGTYMTISAGHLGPLVALHNPEIAMDEDVLPYGVVANVSTAIKYLKD